MTNADRNISQRMSRARGTVAALSIHHASDSPQVIEAKRELRSIKLQEYVAKAVAELPPLSEEQLKEVARLLLPSMVAGWVEAPYMPSEQEIAARRRRAAQDEYSAARRRLDDALDGCRGCGLTRAAHMYQRGVATGYHEWVTLTPDEMIETITAHKPELERLEKALGKH